MLTGFSASGFTTKTMFPDAILINDNRVLAMVEVSAPTTSWVSPIALGMGSLF